MAHKYVIFLGRLNVFYDLSSIPRHPKSYPYIYFYLFILYLKFDKHQIHKTVYIEI